MPVPIRSSPFGSYLDSVLEELAEPASVATCPIGHPRYVPIVWMCVRARDQGERRSAASGRDADGILNAQVGGGMMSQFRHNAIIMTPCPIVRHLLVSAWKGLTVKSITDSM